MKPQPCRSFWDKSRRYPPAIVRMLARGPKRRLMKDEEIAKRSGLSVTEVRLLGSSLQWDVPPSIMEKFLKACGADFEDRKAMQRVFTYLKGSPKLLHLRNDPGWETRWKPLLKQLKLIQQHGN